MSMLQELSKAMAEAVEVSGRCVVRVEGRRRLPASGIVWSEDGVVVTAHHVLERDEEIGIGLTDGGSAQAAIVGRDPSTDLAVVRLAGKRLQPADWAEASSARVGHMVLALGRPGERVLATLGVISALGDAWRTARGGSIDRFFQTDVVMYPGFSGGPLIDASGKALGLNTSGLARGLSLTVPIDTVRRTVETLLKYGRVRRGYLGVGAQTVRLPESSSTGFGQTTGLMIASVEPGGPADRSGLVLGDVLLSLDGMRLDGMEYLLNALNPERVGKTVALEVLRGGQPKTVQVEIGERSHDRGQR